MFICLVLLATRKDKIELYKTCYKSKISFFPFVLLNMTDLHRSVLLGLVLFVIAIIVRA